MKSECLYSACALFSQMDNSHELQFTFRIRFPDFLSISAARNVQSQRFYEN